VRSLIGLVAMMLAGLQATPPALDLTDIVPRERAREPMTSSVSGGGVGGNGPVAQASSITMSLLSVAADPSRQKSSVIFDVELRNISNRKLELPVNPNLADFEPESPRVPYSYMSSYITLQLESQNARWSWKGVSLYGSKSVTGSLREFDPGATLHIRARAPLESNHSGGTSDATATQLRVVAVLLLRENFVGEQNGILHQDSRQIAPQVMSSDVVSLSLRP
jgi:hypothetical protein